MVHADLCGPMEQTSIGGSRYFLISQNDLSRMTFVYFLKSTDEVCQKFREFKAFVENQQNTKIKVLRTDNRDEFCPPVVKSKKMEYCIKKTNPYFPEENEMVERMNRAVVEKARCLLFEANLEEKFFAEAVNMAVYLRNRSLGAA